MKKGKRNCDDYDEEEGSGNEGARDENSSSCDERCKVRNQLTFCAGATYAQELVDMTGQPGQFIPGTDPRGGMIIAFIQLRFSRDFARIHYRLDVFNATQQDNRIISAHLHFGAANVNGPVLVTLFNDPAGRISDGLLAKGTIRNSDITHFNGGTDPSQQVNSVASLYEAIRRGQIYVNVHSQLLQGGAARGQIYFDSQLQYC